MRFMMELYNDAENWATVYCFVYMYCRLLTLYSLKFVSQKVTGLLGMN